MSGTESHEFAARMDALAEAIAFVETFGAAHGVAHDALLRLTLIVEELFTNTVQHGHGGDSAHRIALALAAGPDSLCLVYEDEAPPFDPLARGIAAAAIDAPADARPVGGLGIHLVVQMARQVAYACVRGRNRLTVELARTD